MEQQPSPGAPERHITLPLDCVARIVESLSYAQENLQELKELMELAGRYSNDNSDDSVAEEISVQIATMEELVSILQPKLTGEAA